MRALVTIAQTTWAVNIDGVDIAFVRTARNANGEVVFRARTFNCPGDFQDFWTLDEVRAHYGTTHTVFAEDHPTAQELSRD